MHIEIVEKGNSEFKAQCMVTTRKLINTNGNTEGIFLLVNFREILPTEIFPRYIPTELPWEKNLKQSKKKKDDVSFLPTNSLGNSVGKL